MLSSIFTNTSIPVAEEATYFAQARHNVLAGNIANIDVPGYKVRDLSVETFQKRLGEAIAARDQQREPLSPGETLSPADGDLRKVRESLQDILYHDGTNVSLEQQVTEINKNSSLHSMAVTILASQFRLLQTAVSERV